MATFYALLVPKLRCIRYAGSHFLLDTYNRPLLMTSETADTIAHITLFHQGWTTPTHCCMAHQPVNPSNLDWLHRTHWRMVCQTPRYAGILPGCVSSSYEAGYKTRWHPGLFLSIGAIRRLTGKSRSDLLTVTICGMFVRLSVLLLHAGIDWKLINVWSCGFHRRSGQGSSFLTPNFISQVSREHPCQGFKRDWGKQRWKTYIFDQLVVISRKRGT